MRRSSKAGGVVGLLLFAGAAFGAAPPDRSAFLQERDDLEVLAVERIRVSVDDYQRVLAATENRLRTLHEDYQVAGGTPPSRLDGDVRELRTRCAGVRRQRTAGRPVAPAPGADRLIARRWETHRGGVAAIRSSIEDARRENRPESQVYWEVLRRFDELSAATETALLFNAPPGERSLAEAFAAERAALLAACEFSPPSTVHPDPRVILPEIRRPTPPLRVQTFYRALDQVPQSAPRRSGVFSVPRGARTVTQREKDARFVMRAAAGAGRVTMGSAEADLRYDYVSIPPDTAYSIENTGQETLTIEFVVVEP